LAGLGLGCAEGGDEERPVGEVQVEASHHLFGLVGVRAFSGFPVQASQMTSDRGILMLQSDSTYRVSRNGAVSAPDDYTLAQSGVLGVLINQGKLLPRIRFAGGYGLEGDTGTYYFTDRFTNTTSQNVGLFWGTRIDPAVPDLTGDWHVFSQHVVYSSSNALDPNNVGRSFGGMLAVDQAGMITGSGLESTKASIALSGAVRAFPDGRVDIDLTYQDPQASDLRAFHAGAGARIVLGLDEDESDGESGLLALVRRFDGSAPADRSRLAGDYLAGLHTVFVSATNPGTDAADGVLTFNAADGFTLTATGADGQAFSYSGTYALQDSGELQLTVPATSESWKGAVDQEYKTVVIVDNAVEARSGSKPPELNLLLGLRKAQPPTPP
jgi:hypothetical protein